MSIFTISSAPGAVFGPGSHKLTGGKLKEYGCHKVICLYDPVIGRLGIAGKVVNSIKEAGIAVVEFGECQENPPVWLVDKVADWARSEKVDGVVSVGGGSSLDTAKCVNLLLANPGSILDYSGANRTKPHKKTLPLVLLPTTAGTGAEVTPNYVVTDTVKGAKLGGLHKADLAIVDPEFTYGLPPAITANTGIDALAHAVESYTNPAVHLMADIINEKVIAMVFKNLPLAYSDGSNIEARQAMSFAAMAVGFAFPYKGCHIGHAISDITAVRNHLPHGVGCALGLPIVLQNAAFVCPGKVWRIAELMGLNIPSASSDIEAGVLVADACRQMMRSIGLKSLKDVWDKETLEYIIAALPKDRRFVNNPLAPDFTLVEEIISREYTLD